MTKNKILQKINEIQEVAEKDLDDNKKYGCNSFACGVETGIVANCQQIKKLFNN